jgi:hypothetical protein
MRTTIYELWHFPIGLDEDFDNEGERKSIGIYSSEANAKTAIDVSSPNRASVTGLKASASLIGGSIMTVGRKATSILRVHPGSFAGLTEFSDHQADRRPA